MVPGEVVENKRLDAVLSLILSRPDHFIDAASRLGRLNVLGRVIRARVAAVAERLSPELLLLVNLHPSDLQDDDLIDPNAPLSSQAGRTILEITERASLNGMINLRQRLDSLRRLGFRLAIDDLGVGYAGLSSVATVQPELVKIDMSLVRSIDDNPAKRTVVSSMVDMAAKLDIQVVVEGVETLAERDTLSSVGCDLMQGFLFGRPCSGSRLRISDSRDRRALTPSAVRRQAG